MLCRFNENFQFNKLEIKYKINMYEPPTKAPFRIPFFCAFIFPIELPINILIAVIISITGVIVFSLIFVYVKIAEKIVNRINVTNSDIPVPLNMFLLVSILYTSSLLFINVYYKMYSFILL